MSAKLEQIDRWAPRSNRSKARRNAKRATARARRRLERQHGEDTPIRITKGWVS